MSEGHVTDLNEQLAKVEYTFENMRKLVADLFIIERNKRILSLFNL